MQSFYRIREETTDMDSPFTEHYLRMSEAEKNIETVKAIMRMQNLMFYAVCFHGEEQIRRE